MSIETSVASREGLTARVGAFLKRAGPSLKRPAVSDRLDPERVLQTLRDLHPILANARRAGAFANPWAVAGLSRNEVRTAAVLAWFLHPLESHGAGDSFLQSLWREIDGRSKAGFDLIAPSRTLTEVHPMGDSESRVDVVLEGRNFVVFLEVKIDAPEGKDQLRRYTNAALLSGKKHRAVLFLDNSTAAVPSGCIGLTWKNVAGSLRQAGRELGGDSFAARLASLFADHVSHL